MGCQRRSAVELTSGDIVLLVWAGVVVLFLAMPAVAEPASPEPAAAELAPTAADPALAAFEGCKARRHELSIAAMKVTDQGERTRLLLAMPACRRYEDGSFDVTEQSAVIVDRSPFAPHFEGALRAGYSATAIVSGTTQASGTGPYVELEAAYRFRRSWSLAAFASFTRFEDPAVEVIIGTPIAVASMWDVHETLYDAGVRFHGHAGPFVVGGGVGATVQDAAGVEHASRWEMLRLVELDGAYTFAKTRLFAAQVMLVVEDSGPMLDPTGQLISARLALGIQR